MKSTRYQFGVLVLGVLGSIMFSNCQVLGPGKVTGGGNVEPLVGIGNGTKPVFSISGSSCDDPNHPNGRIEFHDQDAPKYPDGGGLMLQGTVIDISQCQSTTCSGGTFACPLNSYIASGGYKSTNPKYPGVGNVAVCLGDNGEGKSGTGDLLELALTNGPYDGYQVSGKINGNIQGHDCK